MAATVVNDTVTRPAAAALGQHRLVRFNASGQFALCGAGQSPHAVTEKEFASGAQASATLIAPDKTLRLTAAAAITRGALVYAAASGKISATVAGAPVGVALEAASGDNAIIEVATLRQPPFIMTGVASTGSAVFAHGLGANPVVTGLLIRTNAVNSVVREILASDNCTITFTDANTVTVAHADIVSTDTVTLLIQPTN
jgi:hypothetical protein